jgi:hypothetical protein
MNTNLNPERNRLHVADIRGRFGLQHYGTTVIELDLGAAPFRAAAARRVIFIGGGGAPTDFCRRRRRNENVGGVNLRVPADVVDGAVVRRKTFEI